MLGIHELWLFVLSGLLLNVTPGPDTAYIIGRTIQLGWRGGAAAAIGISCGCLVHVLGAAIGLSALLMARLMHVDFLTAYLATSPGGLDSMAIIAVDAHADVGLVLAMQALRLIGVVLTGPLLARQLVKLART